MRFFKEMNESQEAPSVPASFPMPNLLLPWKAWSEANTDPFTMMALARFGGLLSDWLTAIWLPYWNSLSEQERQNLLAGATPEWQEWIQSMEDELPFVKEEYAKSGYHFDYRTAYKSIEYRYYLMKKHGNGLFNVF